MAQSLEFSLDPSVAPARILMRHPDDHVSDLRRHAGSTGASLRHRTTLIDELPVPCKNGIRLGDRGHLLEISPSYRLALGSQSAALIISQHQPLAIALLQEDSVLLEQVVDHGLLVPSNPA